MGKKKYKIYWDRSLSHIEWAEDGDPDAMTFSEAKRKLDKYFRDSVENFRFALRRLRKTRKSQVDALEHELS